MICSARAQEAQFTAGESCSDEFHSDGETPLYMTLNGSSMATPVVAGAAAMARQFLREEVNISEPRSDLIKAILINGATDLGESNIPNPLEGWGRLISHRVFILKLEIKIQIFILTIRALSCLVTASSTH